MTREELLDNISKNIRKHRLKADLSLESLSLCADLSIAYVGKIERCERFPTIDTLYKICEVLNISIFDLLISDNSESCPDPDITYRINSALKKVPKNKKISIVKIIESISEIL